MWRFFHKLGSPKWFYQMTTKWLPWLTAVCVILFAFGLYKGLLDSPPDYQQGHSVRIMYIHVPTAFLSMAIYTMMAVCAAIAYIWRMKMAHIVAASAAPIGACFTFLALVTGAIWGKPSWGTWWMWDARLTSELILLFLYLGYIALQASFDDRDVADKASGILALVGVVNVPIIHYSVEWWNTLHQGATISTTDLKIQGDMLTALLTMIAAFMVFFVIILIRRIHNQILLREQHTHWVREICNG